MTTYRMNAYRPKRAMAASFTKTTLLAAALLATDAALATAMACEPPAFDFDKYLADHDKNKDGYLQKQELLAGASGLRDYTFGNTLDRAVNTEAAFKALDKNHDRRLSRDELWQ